MTEKRRGVLNGASKTQLALLAESITRRNAAWMDRASCPEVDPEIFIPTPEVIGGSLSIYEAHQNAKAVCRGCEVIAECLDHALRYHEVGIWGGTTDVERKEIRRRRNAK